MACSSHHPIPLVCTQTFIIAVFPVLIYVCQWFGKVSSAAGCLSGMLLVLKMMVELRHARQQQKPLRLAIRDAILRSTRWLAAISADICVCCAPLFWKGCVWACVRSVLRVFGYRAEAESITDVSSYAWEQQQMFNIRGV